MPREHFLSNVILNHPSVILNEVKDLGVFLSLRIMGCISKTRVVFFLLVFAAGSFAQLMSAKKTVSDSVKLQEDKPLVLAADSLPANIQALDDSISTVNAAPTLEETAKSAVINKGIEFVSQTLKNSLSPNSAEADAAEKALEYK